jgi:hypothetical protein
MRNKIKRGVLALLAVLLVAVWLSLRPAPVRAGDDPTPTPTSQHGGNPPESCGPGC